MHLLLILSFLFVQCKAMLDQMPWNVVAQIACNLDNQSVNSLLLTCKRTSECFKTESALLRQINNELNESGLIFQQNQIFDELFNHDDPAQIVYQLANMTAQLEMSLFKQLRINYYSGIPEIFQSFAPISSSDSVPRLRDYARAVYRKHPVLRYFHWPAPRHSAHLTFHSERIKKMAYALLRRNTELRVRVSTEPAVKDWLVRSLMHQTFGDLPFATRLKRLIKLKDLARLLSDDTISSAARMALQSSYGPNLLLHSYIMSDSFPFPSITSPKVSRSLLLMLNHNDESNDALVLDRETDILVLKRQNSEKFIENWQAVANQEPAVDHQEMIRIPTFDEYTDDINDRMHDILKKPLSRANSYQYLKQCSLLLSGPILQKMVKQHLQKFWSQSWKFIVLYLSMHFNVHGLLPSYLASAVETTRQTMPRSLILIVAALRIGENFISTSMRTKYQLDQLISRSLLMGTG